MVRKKSARARREWTADHIDCLRNGINLDGEIWPGCGDGPELPAWALEEMQIAWSELGADILSAWTAPGTRPAAWWRFTSPVPRDPEVCQEQQLHDLGILDAAELAGVERRARAENRELHRDGWHQHLPFRRAWLFWRFVTSEPRDESEYESKQLARMNVLTDLERAILDDPNKATTTGVWPCSRTRFYYLNVAERAALGLDNHHTLEPATAG